MHFTDDGGNCLTPIIKKRAFIASLELLERYFSMLGCWWVYRAGKLSPYVQIVHGFMALIRLIETDWILVVSKKYIRLS